MALDPNDPLDEREFKGKEYSPEDIGRFLDHISLEWVERCLVLLADRLNEEKIYMGKTHTSLTLYCARWIKSGKRLSGDKFIVKAREVCQENRNFLCKEANKARGFPTNLT